MPGTSKRTTQRRVQIAFGLVLAAILYAELNQRDYAPVLTHRSAVVIAAPQVAANPFEKLLKEDPLAALIELRTRHLSEVQDYRCTLVKQEVLPSGMSAEQEMEVLFRQHPYSVTLTWVRNAGLAQRVIYVKDLWVDENAENPEDRDLAVCQPGALGAMLIKSIKMPIRGSMARQTARRNIDEFGFTRALDLLIKYCELARSRDELVLEYRGEGRFDGRPVWVVHRHLPYTGEGGLYPDRTAEIYIDQEYHVPVAVYCYSDIEQKPANLLSKYEFRNIRFNVGLTDKDFDPATYGM